VYFDAPGNGDGISAFISGNIGYMVDAAGHLYTFDVSSKAGSRPLLGSINLSGTGKKVYVSGSYVFVAETGATQLEIIQVSNGGASLSVIGNAQVSGLDGQDVFVNSSSTRAYLATSASLTQREMFIIDITSKDGVRPVLGSYESNGMSPKGVTVVTGNKALLVGTGGQEYQVVDITNEASPSNCGGLNIDSGVNGVAAVVESDGDAFSYIITGDATSEFKIIEGGPGGQFATTGTYTSPIFDAGQSVAFNKFTVNHAVPQATTIQYEVAVADAVNGSCSGAVFAYSGPFTQSSVLPASTSDPDYVNPGRCLRYRVTFSTTDITQTPVLSDITFNYSP
jgi:hypothetical protein